MDMYEKLLTEQNDLLAEARSITQKDDFTDKDDARFQTLMSKVKGIGRRLDRMKVDLRLYENKADGLDGTAIRKLLYGGRHDTSTEKPWLPTLKEYRAALAEGSGATGGVVIADQQAGTFFDMLRAKSVVLAAGPRIVTMTSDVCHVPKILSTTSTAFYNEGATLSSTEMTFEAVTLTCRKIAAFCLASNESLADGNPQLLAMVGQDFTTAMALGLDNAFLDGDGSAPTPRGIRNFTSVTETPAATNGSQPTVNMLLAQIGRLEAKNANIERCAWFCHPRDWKTIKAFVDDNGDYYFNQNPSDSFARRIFGIPVYLSTQLSITESEGGSGAVCSSLILADMDQIVVGMRQEVDLQYSSDFAFNLDSVAIRATARMDIQPINVAGVDILTGCTA